LRPVLRPAQRFDPLGEEPQDIGFGDGQP
jgi:hypothetical protein